MKICKKCNIEKPKTEFGKHSRRKDGLQPHCNRCRREHRALTAESISDYQIAYRAANPGKYAEYSRKYFKAYPEKYAERGRAYKAANPEKRAQQKRNRRARNRNSEGGHTAADIREILSAQRGLCVNCQTKLLESGGKKYHVDHVMPLALGGSNWPSNLQCLCPKCNMSKGAKHPDDWAKENGRLL